MNFGEMIFDSCRSSPMDAPWSMQHAPATKISEATAKNTQLHPPAKSLQKRDKMSFLMKKSNEFWRNDFWFMTLIARGCSLICQIREHGVWDWFVLKLLPFLSLFVCWIDWLHCLTPLSAVLKINDGCNSLFHGSLNLCLLRKKWQRLVCEWLQKRKRNEPCPPDFMKQCKGKKLAWSLQDSNHQTWEISSQVSKRSEFKIHKCLQWKAQKNECWTQHMKNSMVRWQFCLSGWYGANFSNTQLHPVVVTVNFFGKWVWSVRMVR